MRLSDQAVASALAILFLFTLYPVDLRAVTRQGSDPDRVVTAVRTTTPPRVDGVPDEPEWRGALPATDFIQRDPDEGQPASEKSEIRVLYDADAIYFGCVFTDSKPDEINSPFTRRDNEIESDWASIRIDSYHDHQTAFEFTFNPAGVKVDILQFDDGNNEDVSWDPVWFVETKLTSTGWTAEVKIPFSVLRYNSPSSDTGESEWGINFFRSISRNQESDRWAFTPKKESGFISRFGHLRGLRDLPDPRQVEVVPFTVGKQSYTPASDVRPRRDEFSGDLGADIKYGLSKNFTLDATINPDFGQVEADPSVLNLSSLETFYPEKRPFFIEGTQFIRFTTFGGEFGPGMFYSRRIGRGISEGEVALGPGDHIEELPQTTTLIGAVKVSGKTTGGLAVGVLEAFTEEERAVVSDSAGNLTEQVVEPFAHYNIIRFRQDVLSNSYVGAIITTVAKTSRQPAFTNGYDWKLRLDGNTYALDGFLALSHTKIFTGERATGSAGKASFSRIAAEHWLWSAGVDFTSKRYDINDAGFFFSPNDYGGSASITYKEDTPARAVRSYTIGGGLHLRQTFDEVNIFRNVSANGGLLFANYWNASWNAGYDFGLYDHRETRGNGLYRKPTSWSASLNLSTDNRNAVVGNLSQSFGGDDKRKREHSTSLGVELRPIPWMRWEVNGQYSREQNTEAWITNDRTASPVVSIFGDRSTETWSLTLRGTLAFTRELTLEYYGQLFFATGFYENYRALSGDASFIPVAPTADLASRNFNRQALNSNLVFRWEYLPGSTIFLVWSQARTGRDDEYMSTVRENVDGTFRLPPANVLLLKVTYWWNV